MPLATPSATQCDEAHVLNQGPVTPPSSALQGSFPNPVGAQCRGAWDAHGPIPTAGACLPLTHPYTPIASNQSSQISKKCTKNTGSWVIFSGSGKWWLFFSYSSVTILAVQEFSLAPVLLPSHGLCQCQHRSLVPMVIKAVSVSLGKYQGWGFLGLVFQQVE